jgi:hypothetical protein
LLFSSDAGQQFLPDRSQHRSPAFPNQMGEFQGMCGCGRRLSAKGQRPDRSVDDDIH